MLFRYDGLLEVKKMVERKGRENSFGACLIEKKENQEVISFQMWMDYEKENVLLIWLTVRYKFTFFFQSFLFYDFYALLMNKKVI